MAHIHDQKELFASLEVLLKKDGVFISQFPYLVDLIEQKQFDTIYHEHLSYFSLRPLLELAKQTGFEIFDVMRNDLDGGSIRVFWKKQGSKKHKVKSDAIKKLLVLEEKKGLYTTKRYDAFANDVEKLQKTVAGKLVSLRKKRKVIVGYGAAAKGNILLNYFKLDKKLIAYLVDSTPYKQGRFSPGVHIPIFEETKIYETHPDYVLILAWNFKKEIIEKNSAYHKNGGRFIILVPEYEVI